MMTYNNSDYSDWFFTFSININTVLVLGWFIMNCVTLKFNNSLTLISKKMKEGTCLIGFL